MIKRLAILFCMLCIAGCGFHLRGTVHTESLPFEQLHLAPYQKPNDPFVQHLATVFEAHDVLLSPQADWQLTLHDQKIESLPIAYGPNGELVREKLKLSMGYRLHHHQTLILDRTLVNNRHHQLNVATKLADAAELEIIKKEMRHDLAQQMIYQLSRLPS